MTRANTSHYVIKDSSGNKVSDEQRYSSDKTNWDYLWMFEPFDGYTIHIYGFDEDEEYWEDDEMKLKDFIKLYNIKIKKKKL